MLAPSNVDLSEVPITAFRETTKYLLETALNPLKVLPTDEGNIPRDWRGVAYFAGVHSASLSQSKNPISDVLRLWDKEKVSKGEKRPSIRDLQDIFGLVDRWDVYDDTEEMMRKDAVEYVSRSLQVQPSVSETLNPFENDCLTTDDYDRLQRGLPLDTYDAFILFADEDRDFAADMIKKLEDGYGLRLCVKDRDLLPGVGFQGFEFKAITKLISERCSTLIAILSPDFLKSSENMFFLTFTQALTIDQRQQNLKRIIPCIYSPCALPVEIRNVSTLDYRRAGLFGNFWVRLKDSIEAAAPNATRFLRDSTSVQTLLKRDRITITEIKSEDKVPDPEPICNEQTTIVRMSDPSTFYPKSPIESTSDEWTASKAPNDVEAEPTKDKSSDSFLSRLKATTSKHKKKWLSKKKAVAVHA